MPTWLRNQLKRAYMNKDRRQIRMLNDCWYFYRSNINIELEHPTGESTIADVQGT